MIDRPFDQMRDAVKASNQKNKELLKYVFEKSDSLSLWIIGLSISGISIFASSVLNIKKQISSSQLSHILILLSISVTAGILYRSVYLYWFIVQNTISDSIDIDFSREKKMHQKSYLAGNETFDELLATVQQATGIDYTHLLSNYNESDDVGKNILYSSMVRYYLSTVDFAKKDAELAIDFMLNTLAKYLGISKEEYLKKIKSQNLGKTHKILTVFIRVFYITFTITFIIALFLFATSV